ncbi:MAG TPA: sodium:solute symporter [Opitutaceae bacterium]|nr:sodium:solute symporter [Opitutaceae bacterium]
MPPPRWRRVVLPILLFTCIAATTRAESLIAIRSSSLTGDEAAQLQTVHSESELPSLPPEMEGMFAPSSHITHNGAVWLLAKDKGGTFHWLRHNASGWSERSPPPAGLMPQLNTGGQAHVLALSSDAAGVVHLHTYHTITDAWADLGPAGLPGSMTGVRAARTGFIVDTLAADGTGARTLLSVELTKRLLKWIDWVIIVVYLGFTAGIGFYYLLRQKKHNNDDFFLGGRTIPWWAAGVSLYATGTSAISYIATPAKSFSENWQYLGANVVGLFGTVFVAIWIVPLIRRLNLMSVYHYLEMRFHPKIRTLASAIAIVLQLGGRMSIVLFLPSLAMSAVTGINVVYSVLIMGLVTIAYTTMGGMKAVIWTDFIQVFVMLGGAFVAIGFVISHVDGGLPEFIRVASNDGKFHTFDWSFDLTKATVWGFLLVVILQSLTYPQDQVMMQRVLSTKSDKEAGWSVWTLAAIVVPGNLTFFAIGTALYVFYKQHPASLNPTLNIDSTFPQFIAAELPAGLTGLIIAGIFAASMSTLSSCINSVATLVSVDFYERHWKNATPAKSVKLAEKVTIIAGLIGIGTALLLALADIKSALDTSFVLIGLLGGGFAGCYALGMFTRRANWQGAFIGVGASLVITFTAWIFNAVHPYFYIVIAILTCIVVGYASSYMFPPPQQSLVGLTVYTPRREPVVIERA